MMYETHLINREDVIQIILDSAIENHIDTDFIVALVTKINQLTYYDVQKM